MGSRTQVPVRRFELTPRGAFSLAMANRHFGGWIGAGDAEATTVPLAFPLESWDESAAVTLSQSEAGRMVGDVYCRPEHSEAAWQQALAVLSLDVDGDGFAAVGVRDPIISAQQRLRPGLRPVLFHSPYEAACSFIIGHGISMAQGRAIRTRMADQCGDAVSTASGVRRAFPRPQVLLELDSFPGVAAAKFERLHAAARAALDQKLQRDRLRSLPEPAALAELRQIPGIGPFFAQGVLMRGAGLVDAVTDDAVSRQAVQRAYGLSALPSQQQVLEIAEAWRPFRMWVLVLLHVWLRRDAGGPAVASRS